MLLKINGKLGIADAKELLAYKYDAKTAEVLENSLFEQNM
jgi:hypothetical protein